MTGLDTNVLVRFLTHDDAAQTRRVQSLFEESRRAGETLFVSVIVLCEAAWVLKAVYGIGKSQVLDSLDRLLNVDVLTIEDIDGVRTAIASSRGHRGDFSDHLIGTLNRSRGCRATATFDRALIGVPEFKVL